jgi:hypothetical protein
MGSSPASSVAIVAAPASIDRGDRRMLAHESPDADA